MAQDILSLLLAQATEMKSQLDTLRPISHEQEKRIMDKFRLDWNYHSNHIEGNSYTYGETKMLILHGITSGGKPLKDGLEIKGHNEALLWILDVIKGDYPITETFIRELNEKILGEPYDLDAITPEGVPTKRRITPGQYKTQPNHVITKTGEIFRFAEPFETPSKMDDLVQWFRGEKENPNANPVVLATEFHYRFIRIHPFDDGNGRTARILMNFILMQYGYPPAIIRTEEKEGYYAALREADVGNLSVFFEYVTREVIRSLDIMLRGANGENIDDDDDIDKEIELLKSEIKNDMTKKFSSKTEKIEYALENSIIPLVSYIFDGLTEFNDFYQYEQERIAVYDGVPNTDSYGNIMNYDYTERRDGDDIFFPYIPHNVNINFLSALEFFLNFKGLTFKIDKENYALLIDISVSKENYFTLQIRTSHSANDSLYTMQKTYLEKFSEVEQKTILKLIKKDHLAFIKTHKK